MNKLGMPLIGILALTMLIIACSPNVELESWFDSSADTFYTIAIMVQFIASMLLLFQEGTVGPNQYGPDRVSR